MAKQNNEKIIAALLSAGTVRGAAKIANVTEKTVRNRLEDPEFRERYEKAKSEILTEAMDALSARLSDAVSTIADVMEDSDNPASVRVSAADSVLRHGLRYIEAGNILKRLDALEAIENEN